MKVFSTQHRVQFYETDLMGIVHHSNYLRFYEEARVQWANEKGLIVFDRKASAFHFAVLETFVRHVKPSYFGDLLVCEVQSKIEGVRLIFQYRLTCPARKNEIISVGKTVHVPLNEDLKLVRPTQSMKNIMEKELWTEIWL